MLAENPCSWGWSSGGKQEARHTYPELQETERYQKSWSGLSRYEGKTFQGFSWQGAQGAVAAKIIAGSRATLIEV